MSHLASQSHTLTNKPTNRSPVIWVASTIYVIWSAIFIYRTSFIAIDSKRYFALFDDAMISMRYAWNFAHGDGLVWNPGERIQGYTNLLMTLLMSLVSLFTDKSSAVLIIQILGIVFMLLIAYLAMRLADYLVGDEKAPRSAWIGTAAFICTLCYYPLNYWSLMGMETGLLTLLVLSSLLAALQYTQSRNTKLLFAASISLGLAYLTRNDSLVFAFLIGAYVLWESYTAGAFSRNRRFLLPIGGALLLYACFVVGQSLFQYAYYGEYLPNTYTLKLTGMPFLTRIYNGIRFVLRFGVESALILFVPTINLITNFRKQKLLLLALIFAALSYQIYVGGDAWNYWRIMAPTIPLAFLLYSCAIMEWLDLGLPRKIHPNRLSPNSLLRDGYSRSVLTLALIFVAVLATNLRFLPEILGTTKPYQAEFNQDNTNVALALTEVTTDDATLGVLWAGVIPYYAERQAIDFLGKMDRRIANVPPDLSGSIRWAAMLSVPGHNKYDLDYSIKELKPTYVQTFTWGQDNLSEWSESRYVTVEYKGIRLSLLKDSPYIFWEKVNIP